MSRQKGIPNKNREQLDVSTHNDQGISIPGDVVELPMNRTKRTKEVLLKIVDALYAKDLNAKVWGDIRKEIEKL